jgi:hypothetical protein
MRPDEISVFYATKKCYYISGVAKTIAEKKNFQVG